VDLAEVLVFRPLNFEVLFSLKAKTNKFNSGRVHFQAFTERTTLAHQYPAALAQGAGNRLLHARLAFAFGAGPVLVAG